LTASVRSAADSMCFKLVYIVNIKRPIFYVLKERAIIRHFIPSKRDSSCC